MEQTYYLHINGIDPFLWRTVPTCLKGGAGQLPLRLRGGLAIDFLGHKLQRRAPLEPSKTLKVRMPASWRPPDGAAAPGGAGGASGSGAGGGGAEGDLGETPLRQMLRHAQELGVEPFWLAARWCPKGKRPEDPQPSAEEIEAASGHASRGSDDPAGLLVGVHRDFLMCLLFYPFMEE
jgi:hypothetical protein